MKHFLPSLLGWFLILSASAQAPLRFTPVFRNYTTDDGLPSNETFAIQQDHQGYMWFSTNNGVCRFNGYQFEQFPDTLQANFTSVMCPGMMEDSCGRMWWADFQGRVFYHENGHIYPWKYNAVLDSLKPRFSILHSIIVKGCGEEIWLSAYNLGILHFDKNGGHQVLYRPDSTDTHLFEWKGRVISAFVPRLDLNNPFEPFPPLYLHSEGLSTLALPNPVRSNLLMHYGNKLSGGRYLVGRAQYLYLFQDASLQWWGTYDKEIVWILEEQDGSLLVGHRRGGGVRRFASVDDLKRGKIADSFLEGLSISNIFKDREGGYWFGSQERGLFYTPSLQSGIAEGLPGMAEDVVKGVVADGAGRLYFGTYNGRVFELDLFRKECRDISPGTLKFLNTLYYDDENQMLFCAGHDFSMYHKEKWLDNLFSVEGNPLPHKRSQSGTRFACHPGKKLWSASPDALVLLDLEKRVQLENTVFGLKKRMRFYAVCVGPGGRVWTSTNMGLAEYKKGQLLPPGIAHPAFEQPAYDLLALPDSTIVFSPKGYGVAFWKPDSGALPFVISEAQGLISNRVNRLFIEPGGAVWACTERGASRISADRQHLENFSVKNGLPSNAVHQIAMANGYYWLATEKGLMRMKKKLPGAPMPPPVIEQVAINGRAYETETYINLPYDSSDIRIEWVALHFRSNAQIAYRYRLKINERTSWTNTFGREVNYSNLQHGAYQFEVQAQNEVGQWSASTVLAISIRPPWWQTGLFYALLAIAIGGAIFWMYKYRTGQLKRQFAIKQQMSELERRALQAQMNPHFIFNCLNSIQGFIATNDKDKAANYLARFAKLIRQALHSSFQKQIPLEDEIAYLENYLSLEHLRFYDAFQYEIHVDEKLDLYETALPSMLIQPFVENSIVHGMKGKSGDGLIVLRFEKYGDTGIRIFIEDNGSGFRQVNDGNSNRTSYGLQLATRRLALADQYANAAIHSGKNEGGGTRVEIVLA